MATSKHCSHNGQGCKPDQGTAHERWASDCTLCPRANSATYSIPATTLAPLRRPAGTHHGHPEVRAGCEGRRPLATHDLEIRGAGEILGEEQSGHIQEIGFGLYSELLQRAVADLKSGPEPLLDRPLDHGTEIELHTACLIPEDYLPVHTRLILYKRIASAADDAALTLIMEEMADRFGRLPVPAKDLCRVTRLKLRAAPLGVKRVDLGPRGGRIVFHPEAPIDPLSVVRLVQTNPLAIASRPTSGSASRPIYPTASSAWTPSTRFSTDSRIGQQPQAPPGEIESEEIPPAREQASPIVKHRGIISRLMRPMGIATRAIADHAYL